MTRLILSSLAMLVATSAVACGGSKAPANVTYSGGDAHAYPQPGQAPASVDAEYDGDDAGGAEEMAPPPSPAGGVAKSAPRRPHDPFSLQQKKRSRPGLATSWGESRHSRVSSAPFIRAQMTRPFGVGKLFYNDPAGISAMSDSHPGWRSHGRRFAIGSGHVEFGLRDGSGNFLTGFQASGNNYVTGISGRRYTIVVKNQSPGRIEAVVSVDGLDVVDGKPASMKKRGYLIEPFGDLEVEGFRTSNTEVAAFRFGSVQNSYSAKKHGKTRNVGVIGVAVFHEKGDNPSHWGHPGDASTRHGADPFPQKFASPP